MTTHEAQSGQPSHPRVSVCIVTYNQREYIEQCLLSALTQQTSFPFEVIVGDDASTDDTPKIIERLAAEYPNLRVIRHPQNVGAVANYLEVHKAARGDYVAHLDGDDYWLPGKLEAQAAVLDSRPDVVLVWHPLIAFDESGTHYVIGDHGDLERELFGKDHLELEDAIIGAGVHGFPSSSMYRRPAWRLADFPRGKALFDYRVSLSILEHGRGYHMQEPLGCYRAFHDYSLTRGGRDFVGQALLVTLRDYSQSHPHLRGLIAAHCLHESLRRVGVPRRLTRLVLGRLPPGTIAPPRSNRLRADQAKWLLTQVRRRIAYAANQPKFVLEGIRQLRFPVLSAVRNARTITRHAESRPDYQKPGFFETPYGAEIRIPTQANRTPEDSSRVGEP
jgi:glycosyltransferase involved in cell wall biosynthesis